jgi:hypothetical protein
MAIFSHLGVEQFRFVDYPGLDLLPLLTRMSTPIFMTLFGTMISVIYMERFAGDPVQRASAVHRLLARAITCYVAYGAITLAALIGGKIRMENVVAAMSFAGGGRFGEVLKIYSLLFLVIVALVPLIRRFGVWAIVSAAILAWGARAAIDAVAGAGHYRLQFVFGYDKGFGPSVLLALTFVAFGALLGDAIRGRRSFTVPIATVGVAVLMLAAGAVAMGPVKLATGLGTYALRGENSPLYYAYGIVASGAVLLLFSAAERYRVASGTTSLLARVGTHSLFFYAFGNVAMNLLPIYDGHPLVALVLSVGFLVGLTLITLDLARSDSRVDRLLGGFLTTFRIGYDAALRWLLSRRDGFY